MPLHLAIWLKHSWAIAFVVYRGAILNEPNSAGITPLMLAAETWSENARNGQMEILRLLLNGMSMSKHETAILKCQRLI